MCCMAGGLRELPGASASDCAAPSAVRSRSDSPALEASWRELDLNIFEWGAQAPSVLRARGVGGPVPWGDPPLRDTAGEPVEAWRRSDAAVITLPVGGFLRDPVRDCALRVRRVLVLPRTVGPDRLRLLGRSARLLEGFTLPGLAAMDAAWVS